MNYGLPYMGSKNRIAQALIDVMPKAHTFVDLFAGGCAVTHAAMLSGKYSAFIANDLDGAMPQLFLDAINGKFKDEKRWISREDFEKLKDIEPYIAIVWSFGNNKEKGYMYGNHVEPWKKALHYARVFGDTSLLKEFGIDGDGGYGDVQKHHEEYKSKYVSWFKKNNENLSSDEFQNLQLLESLQRLQRLQSLQRLQRLQRLQSLQSLEITSGDYRAVDIPADAVVYCDIPYRGTAAYTVGEFDHDQFYEWALSRPFPVFVSEYAMPPEFVCVWDIKHHSILSGTANNAVTEKLFCNKKDFGRLGQLSFL